MMARLPQNPTDRDVDEWIDQIGGRLVHGTSNREHLLVQIEITVLRRYIDKLHRRLRDMDGVVLDLKDQLVGGGER